MKSFHGNGVHLSMDRGRGGGASFLSRGGGAPLWETLPLDFFWHQPFLTNSESFAISGNTNIDCVLIRNLLFA